MDRVDAVLAAMPATRAEIIAKTGLTKGSVQNAVEKLHAARWCHVSGWRREKRNNTGTFVQRLSAGPGKDKPCTLQPLTQKQRDNLRQARLIKSGDIEERRRGNLMRYYERRAKSRKNDWLGPLR